MNNYRQPYKKIIEFTLIFINLLIYNYIFVMSYQLIFLKTKIEIPTKYYPLPPCENCEIKELNKPIKI